MIRKDQVEGVIRKLFAKIKGTTVVAGQKSGYDKWSYEKKRRTMIIVLILLFALPFTIRGCFRGGKPEGVPPRPVQTAVAVKKDVPIYLDSFGQMVSVGDVDIRTQVTGKILEVKFVQGDEVEAGDQLFLMDPAPCQAELNKAEALLAENTALMRLKADTLSRNTGLFEKGLISRQEIEQYQTALEAATSTVELNKAGVEAARIDLVYCEIKSPVRGVAGRRQVDPGNIVSANSGPVLVNIKVVEDLYVDFPLAEKHLTVVRSAMAKEQLEVKVFVPGEDDLSVSGRLDLVDNCVDNKTGTFTLRASVDNKDKSLWPGQFVNVRLILRQEKGAVLVSYAATKIGKQGYYVFVVSEDGTADLRAVTIGSRQGADIVIEKGVSEGETVVTEGQLGLSPGAPVFDVSKLPSGEKATR